MRKQPILTGEYYHIYNRGVDKRDIFSDESDLSRFIESVCEFNIIDTIGSLANLRKTRVAPQTAPKALSEPLVSIIVYCFNPNHFHFILKQLVDGGIAKFMQKLQAGYSCYFNAKHTRTGALFQGTFKAHLIKSDNYFKKTIGYVNNNNEIHDIPKNKINLVSSSNHEYKDNNFKIVSKIDGEEILELFGGNKKFVKHCKEIVAIIRKERGKASLLEEDNLPDSASR